MPGSGKGNLGCVLALCMEKHSGITYQIFLYYSADALATATLMTLLSAHLGLQPPVPMLVFVPLSVPSVLLSVMH